MPDGEYSQKEENTFRENLKETLSNQDTMLNKIYEQTLKTNGRVNKHDWYFKLMWWVLGVFGTIGLYIIGEYIHTWFKIK